MPDISEPKRVQAKEHEPIDSEQFSGIANLEQLLQAKAVSSEKKEALGLHHVQKGLAPGNYIGAVWLGGEDGNCALTVRPKFAQMDYLRMYLQCAEDPAVKERTRKCIEIWPGQRLIQVQQAPWLSELLLVNFLCELNQLCVRHLRHHFRSETANLTGKVKGRIRMSMQVRQNLSRGRPDRVWCTYQTIRQDIPENRALRAALEQSVKWLNRRGKPAKSVVKQPLVKQWMRTSRTALEQVPVTKIALSQLSRLRTTGAFAHYRRALALARFVLRRIGTDLPDAAAEKPSDTPPFAIASAELFECYALKALRKQYEGLEQGRRVASANISPEPDYWVRKRHDDPHSPRAKILDAKYKRLEGEKDSKPAREDLYQMIAYSQHRELRRKLGCDTEGEPIALYLVYPGFEEGDEEHPVIREGALLEDFITPIQLLTVPCPTLAENQGK